MKTSSRSIRPFTFALALTVFFTIAHAQAGERGQAISRAGISAAVEGSQKDILFPLWISKHCVLTPAFYFTSASDAYKDFGLGIGVRANLRTGKAVPYVGARFGSLFYVPLGGKTVTDFIVGPTLGGEYFLDDHFSVGVEAQLNWAISADVSKRFNYPGGTVVNTATLVMATFYF